MTLSVQGLRDSLLHSLQLMDSLPWYQGGISRSKGFLTRNGFLSSNGFLAHAQRLMKSKNNAIHLILPITRYLAFSLSLRITT